MSRFVFIRKVQIWFGFTCQQVPPPPRYLSRSKCQLLTVSRNAYKTLVEERVRVNSAFVRTAIDQQAVESLPESGVPQQLIDCGVLEKTMMLPTRSAMQLAARATRRTRIENLLQRHLICNSISVKRLLAWIRHLHQTLRKKRGFCLERMTDLPYRGGN